ncbi:MAG TPA: TetR/AcrR family transcriptional regulator [Pseudogracilibacillus sp.]|nr:TetR/AcrR family transcriptional regulator [Pseudogracilibacillus sp.]
MNKSRPKYGQIIEAALQVIAENGYHASQVSKIAKQADVADGTIYLYFKNKEDILISVFKEKMGSFIKQIDYKIKAEKTADKQLLTLIESHYSQLSENKYLAIVTQLELRQSKPKLREEINNVLKEYLDIIDLVIQNGIDEGYFRKDIDIRLMRQMIFGTLDETVTSWVMKSHRYNLLDQAPIVHELLTRGFTVQKQSIGGV